MAREQWRGINPGPECYVAVYEEADPNYGECAASEKKRTCAKEEQAASANESVEFIAVHNSKFD
jgi:hypothetical protein